MRGGGGGARRLSASHSQGTRVRDCPHMAAGQRMDPPPSCRRQATNRIASSTASVSVSTTGTPTSSRLALLCDPPV